MPDMPTSQGPAPDAGEAFDGGRTLKVVIGALAAAAVIATALFFGEDVFSDGSDLVGETASIDTPHVQAPSATMHQ